MSDSTVTSSPPGPPPDGAGAGTNSGTDPAAAAALKPGDVLAAAATQDWQIPPTQAAVEDPLLWCLATLAGLLGRAISMTALSAGLPLSNGRFLPENATRAMERAEMRSRLIRRPEVRTINPITLPCILLLKNRGACLLLKFLPEGQARILTSEEGGEHTVPVAEVQEQYAGPVAATRGLELALK